MKNCYRKTYRYVTFKLDRFYCWQPLHISYFVILLLAVEYIVLYLDKGSYDRTFKRPTLLSGVSFYSTRQ
jgi:hypothetical protein